MNKIRVLLADDHRLFRAGVRALLQSVPEFEVIGEASDGHEALALVTSQCPHVLVTDISMPGMNGLEVAGRVAERFPDVRVILLTMHATEQYVGQALIAGAAGYLLKDSAPAELETAIRAVARGESYLSPAVSGHLVTAYRRGTGADPNPIANLTPRQREVLRLIGEGKTTKEIARILGVGLRTAETHRLHLMKRLDVHNVAGLVRHAARAGLVNLE
jgi:DNA-binding NarL/FixJ family response regulator